MPASRYCRSCKAELSPRDIAAGQARPIDETSGICPYCLKLPEKQKTEIAPPAPVPQKIQKPQGRRVADNETFIIMITAAQEDKGMRDKILAIAQLSSFHRTSLINSLVIDLMKQGNKASSLASAISCLKDDCVAKKIIEILT